MPHRTIRTLLAKLAGPALPLRETAAQKLRLALQLIFLALILAIGFEFRNFVSSILEGGALSRRPPGVDGFLPISALMNLRLFAFSGELHRAHPAGLFILLAIIAMSFVIGKSFCGWLCPFGLISELLYKARKLASPSLKPPPAWLDYTLGALKYIILAFFVYIIFFAMDAAAVKAFLDGDYNKISDVKMYYFFARITPLAAFITALLFLLSFFVPYFWCRFLCPYGALLGLVSLASPVKIKRDAGACVSCGLCAAACPQAIAVDKAASVLSDECTACALCLDICPAPGALELRVMGTGLKIKTRLLPFLAAFIFCLITGLAMLSGNWRGEVSDDDYRRLTVDCDTLDHPRW
ncbi:MAG: 4Fe-4S binding protein [Elusimicrobiota bacterium]|nr:4Fe-4S binding protein [Elusimicrobiota bacterium]